MEFGNDEEPMRPAMTPAVRWIVALNVAVFFLQLTVIGSDDTIHALAFNAAAIGTRPWTIITYMFVHAGFWHIASNLWLLYMFGPRVERAFGTRLFAMFYLWCGLGGWFAHLMIVPSGSFLLGASAAIFGVLLAYAMRWPNDEVQIFPLFITLKVRTVVILLAAMNVLFGLSTVSQMSGVAYFAHLGGLTAGLLWLYAAKAPRLDRVRQRISAVPDVPDEPPRAVPRPQARTRERVTETDEVVARSNAVAMQRTARSGPVVDTPGKLPKDELDSVLDKISHFGLDSLTPGERRLLEEMSKRLRDR